MPRKHHYRKHSKEAPELDITAFLNLMVVLVPFLLITAVFSRITIMELSVPIGAGAGQADEPVLVLEVIVRKEGLDIGNGQGIVLSIPKVNDAYDIPALSEYLQQIKQNYPEKTDATVLMEPDLDYEYLILIMDAVRSAEIKKAGVDASGSAPGSGTQSGTESGAESVAEGLVDRIILFTDISVGDAP